MSKRQVVLPNQWLARPYQAALWSAMMTGKNPLRRACVIWPRRGGKDRSALAMTSVQAFRKPATYWHMLPTNVQARRVIWDAVSRNGGSLIDEVFPKALQKGKNDAEMGIELKNGARWYAVGSDNYDRLVGSDPFGVVMSEYALANPGAWDYIRPILAENGGWAMFLYTPRGRNHGYSLYNMAASNPDWFCELLSTEQTKHISAADVDAERRAGMPEDMIQQEFFCSFTAGAAGAYYGKLMEEARAQGRITNVPYDPAYSMELWLDLGFNDATAVWAVQPKGMALHAVKYHEFKSMSIPAICAEIKKWGFTGIDLLRLPHDGEAHEQGTGRTKREMYEEGLGCTSEDSPRPRNGDALSEQINGVRNLIPLTSFDAKECEAGIFALESYCREWNEKTKSYNNVPKHDWSSHGADAFRTGAARHRPGLFGSSGVAGAGRASMRVRKPTVIRAGVKQGPVEESWQDIWQRPF